MYLTSDCGASAPGTRSGLAPETGVYSIWIPISPVILVGLALDGINHTGLAIRAIISVKSDSALLSWYCLGSRSSAGV